MFIDLPPPSSNIEQQAPPAMVDGVSAKLVPQKTENMTFPGTTFSFGVYREILTSETDTNYNPSGLGVSFGMQQHLLGFWSGGLEFMWSDWIAKQSSTTSLGNTSPLSIFSKIEGAPSVRYFLGDKWGELIKPYFTGGLGYTLFFDNRSFLAARTKSAFGQFAATFGGGLRIVMPQSFAVKLSFEWWRGIQTSEYTAETCKITFSFGDVDNM